MFLERLEVQEGFLDGLDLEFTSGLNVIIGARGTGKTSALELLRFCLDAEAFTDDTKARAQQQAIAVLEGGRVTVTVRDGSDRLVVSRSAADETPQAPAPIPRLTVLSQNELEAVGATASGRLRLIDRFRPVAAEASPKAASLASELRSLTSEVRSLLDEKDAIDEQLRGLAQVPDELAGALAAQTAALASAEASKKDSDELEALQATAAALAVRTSVFARTKTALNTFVTQSQQLRRAVPRIEDWPPGARGPDMLSLVRRDVREVHRLLTEADEALQAAIGRVDGLVTQSVLDKAEVEESARTLRRALNQLQEGFSGLSRKVAELKERQGQIAVLTELRQSRLTRIRELQSHRGEVYKELDNIRENRYRERVDVATSLNQALSPRISVEVIKSGNPTRYSNSIVAALRGTGVHYNTLAPLLTEKLSPLELVELVEHNDTRTLSDATGLPFERASNALGALRGTRLSDVIAADIDDAIQLKLLDGVDYKNSDTLSIGQRCTVVLPILLSGHDDVLVVDQPEDHLDNAFITETLVESLKRRTESDQFIFASHNANIPVLGEADQVIVLQSDGRRAFVSHAGHLDHPDTVRAVTSLMEGGRAAFAKRAAFYREILGNLE